MFRPAIVLFIVLSIITGVVYPLAITGVAQLVFPHRAGGSLIRAADGRVVGSALIGQEFSAGDAKEAARWFWGRPSATGPVPYTALNTATATGSTGSNLGPTNPALLENVKVRLAALAAADAAVGYARAAGERAPVDLVTASASGLDPHISPAAAEYQAGRVARARGLSEEAVRELVRHHTTGRGLGVLGEPVVNVLELNLDLSGRGG
ncbi:MAG: potassium-transporting ATPase subunit KdpC [Phycisphaerales bacterium]|nr:potassium-transporting ATPase subunit KdpC [Phycisphaerales bacterium]